VPISIESLPKVDDERTKPIDTRVFRLIGSIGESADSVGARAKRSNRAEKG